MVILIPFERNPKRFFFRLISGQQQMYKLIQPSGKPVGNIMTSLTAQPVKLIKSPVTGHDTTHVS